MRLGTCHTELAELELERSYLLKPHLTEPLRGRKGGNLGKSGNAWSHQRGSPLHEME